MLQDMSDRALKERIIGAVVLVVFAVLVVPIFLDGTSDEEQIVSEAVTLPGQNSQNRTQQTVVLDRDRSVPVPASRTPTPAASEALPEPLSQPQEEAPAEQQVAVAAPEQEPVEEEAAPATTADIPAPTPAVASSATGMWAVQLGSFSNKENAERLAASLRDQGYAAFLSQLNTDSGSLHRVRIGPQKDRDSAEAIAAQLAKSGHEGRAVPHP